MKLTTKFWIAIAVLVVLSPLGLIIPAHFKAGGAWGEWSAGEIQKLAGYVPQGLKKLSSLWNAPMPDYTIKSWQGKGLKQLSFAYIISAAVGVLVIIAVVFILGKLLAKKDNGV